MRGLGIKGRAAVVALVLVCAGAVVARGDNSYTNWPPEPEWDSLRAHIDACYRGIVDRCLAVGVSTNDFGPPIYVCPLYDYMRFAEKIDGICGQFVCQTQAIEGSFDTYLTTPGTNGQYPAGLPLWTPETLHAAVGSTNWATNSILHSWMLCDRTIQTQVTAALNLLKVTSQMAEPIGEPFALPGLMASAFLMMDGELRMGGELEEEEPEGQWQWQGYGWDDVTAVDSNNYAVWPYAVLNSDVEPTVSGFTGQTIDWMHDLNYNMYTYDGPEGASYEDARPGWNHLWDVALRGAATNWSLPYATNVVFDIRYWDVSLAWGGPNDLPLTWSSTQVSGAQCRADALVSPLLCWIYYTNDYPYGAVSGWCVFDELVYREPFIDARRGRSPVGVADGLATNVPSRRDLYLKGGLPDPMYVEYDVIPEHFEWASEIEGLNTNTFVRVFQSDASSATNEYYRGTNFTEAPFTNDIAVQKGWAVEGGMWAIEWEFPLLETAAESDPSEDPDTDRDDIVDVDAETQGLAPETGLIALGVAEDRPCVIVPLGQVPAWCQGLPFRVYLSQGAFSHLPYQYLVGDPLVAPGDLFSQYGRQVTQDDDGPRQALSLNSRILETGCVDEGTNHVKRVSVIRPRGNIVVFDFPWTGTNFSARGYPMGINAGRSYVLRDATPNDHTDWEYNLCFASGVTHHYHGLESPWRPGHLTRVTRIDGLQADVGFLSNDTYLTFPGGAIKWWSSAIVEPTANGMAVDHARDARWLIEWDREWGRVAEVRYRTRDGVVTVATSLDYDTAGWITGLNKSGLPGIEKSNARIEGNGVTYPWGRVERTASGPAGAPRTVTLSTTVSDSGATTSEALLNADGRATQVKLTANGTVATTTVAYDPAEERYATNGLLKKSLPTSVTGPDGDTVAFTYQPDTGWPATATRAVGNGLDLVTTFLYETHGEEDEGDEADPTRLAERPRTVETSFGGTVIGRELLSYTGVVGQKAQECRDPGAGWGSTSNLETVVIRSAGTAPSWEDIEEQGPLQGLALSLSAPDYSVAYAWEAGSNSLILVAADSYGETSSRRLNGHGVAESDVVVDTASGIVIASATSTVDSVGRPLVTTYLDGTYTEYLDLDLFGPQRIRGVDGAETVIGRDALGRVTAIEEPALSRTVTYAYDDMDNVVRIVEGALVVETGYDALGRPLWARDPLGTTTWTHETTESGTRTTCTRPGGGVVVEERYHGGALKEVSGSGVSAPIRMQYAVQNARLCATEIRVAEGDAEDEWTQTTFDLSGRPYAGTRSGVEGESRIEYDSSGRPYKHVDEEGITRLTEFNSRNEIARIGVKLAGNPNALEADGFDRLRAYGRTVSVAGIRRETTVYPRPGVAEGEPLWVSTVSLDGRQNDSTVAGRTGTSVRGPVAAGGCWTEEYTASDGTRVSSVYEKWRLAREERRDAAGASVEVLTCAYDGMGALKTVTSSESGTTRYVLDAARRLKEIVPSDPAKERVTYAYAPGTRRVIEERRADGSTVHRAYYPNGLLQRQWDGSSYDISFEYDTQGRRTRMTTLRDGQPVVTEWRYDPVTGWLKSRWIGGMQVESYTHRRNGQVAAVTDAGGAVTDFLHDGAGALTGTVCRVDGKVQRRVIDRLGRVESMGEAGGLGESYEYTLEGQVQAVQVSGGGVVSNAWVRYTRATNHPGVVAMDWEIEGGSDGHLGVAYNAATWVAGLSNETVMVGYGYVSNGSLVDRTTVAAGGGVALVRDVGWDRLNGRVTNIAYRVGEATVASFAYTHGKNRDSIETMTEADGSWWQYEYDSRDQLAAARKRETGGKVAADYRYGYDSMGNTTNIAGSGAGEFVANDLNFHVTRVWSNRVEIAGTARAGAAVSVNDIPCERQGGTYRGVVPVDATSSAVETTLVVRAVWFNGTNDVMATVGGTVFVPKATEGLGHLDTGRLAETSRFRYEWNGRGQLAAATSTNAAPDFRLTFEYYPNGQRATKSVYAEQAGDWSLVRKHEFYYDNWNLISENVSDYSHTPTLRYSLTYTWGQDLAGQRSGKLGQESGGIGGLMAITETTGSVSRTYLPVADHNGTIRALVDAATGAVVAEYEFSPFGALVSVVESPENRVVNPFLFQSKYYDAETELYYYGYRYYDPVSTKWLSRDPLGESGDLNLTAFCRNDPVNNVDPLGLEAYIVYREFADESLRKKFPSQGHVFLAFDEKGLSNVDKWRDMVNNKLGTYTPAGTESAFGPASGRKEDDPNADKETFSFHPWEVYDEGEGKGYNIAGTVLSLSSYVGYGDAVDRDAFENARDNLSNPKARKAILFPLHVTEEQQFELYQKAIASRNINNAAPQSWDIGPYMVGAQNCGSWTVWLTRQVKGVKYPSAMRKYNRLPILPYVSVGGVGIGGVADYTLLPQTATLVIGTGGAVYQGTKLAGYGLYRGGEAAVDVGRVIVDRAEFFQPEGGLVGWRF